MSSTSTNFKERAGRSNIENNDSSPNMGLLKYKRRKVSATRDFPPGCGRCVMQNNSLPINGTIGINIVDNCYSMHHGSLRSVEILDANIALESLAKEPDISFGLEKDGDDLKGAELLLMIDTEEKNHTSTENVNFASHGTSFEDVCQVAISSTKDDTLQLSDTRPCAPSTYPASVSNGDDVMKVVVRKYPPRRKVSASRDFPPFCGQNAPPLAKVCSSLVASLNIHPTNQKNVGFHNDSSYLNNDVECAVDNVYESKHDSKLAENMKNSNGDKSQAVVVQSIKEVEMRDKHGLGNKCTIAKNMETSHVNDFKSNNTFKISLTKGREGLEKEIGKEIVVYTGDATPNDDMLDMYSHQKELKIEPIQQIPAAKRFVVQGLMASPNCPWRQGKLSYNSSPMGGSSERKMNKRDFRQLETTKSILRIEGAKEYRKNSLTKKLMIKKDSSSRDAHQLVIRGDAGVDASDSLNAASGGKYRSSDIDVSLIPFSQINENMEDHGYDSKGTRTLVREALRLFQAVCRKLLQEEETGKKAKGSSSKRVDLIAAKILKDKGKYVNVGKQILGSVPGVEVGDEFHYRVELNIVGLHRQIQGGIDYVKRGQKILATSIVASGGYTNNVDNSDVLIYIGQGGNMINSDKEPEDQKLERGNLALKNSFDEKTPVRVIRGSDSSDGRTYVYDGLYLVEKWWQEVGPHGKLVFMYQLCRIPGQPELAWKELKKSNKFKVREGLCVDNISQGKESIPICAVNTIDDEKPPPFNYITRMIYPDWCRPIPLKGCDCTNGCSDSERCSCAVLNGGEIPFNYNGAIVEAKSLVYECGPSCKCLPSCHNRVSQHGIKFQLEIFKTESRGWGVRSRNSIPSGSFICEYIGELLEDKEAEKRTGNDEYLFDIGNGNGDNSLWDGLSALLPDAHSSNCDIVEDGSFTIDAAEFGNIGRFINHSCSPNLYAQNVLYDHEDKRIPHIMFFAAENIPPLQELSYHYNYMMNQVRDSNGNIKNKRCYCGSADCTGWMY